MRKSGRSGRGRMLARLALLCGMVLSLALLAGCGGSSGPPSAETLLKTAKQKLDAAQTFHFIMQADKLGDAPPGLLNVTQAEGDVKRPAQLSASGKVNLAGFIVPTRLIIIEDKAWYQNPLTGSWDREDEAASFAALFAPNNGVSNVLTSLKNPTKPADGKVNGVDCWKITGDVDPKALGDLLGGAATTSKPARTTVCIGKSDGKLYSAVVVGQVAQGDRDDTTRSFYLSKYDAPVSINPPA